MANNGKIYRGENLEQIAFPLGGIGAGGVSLSGIGELIDEGVALVDAVRERYDGKKRNPFAEIECGSSYARSMASFALPALFAGYTFDLPRGEIGFAPLARKAGERFVSFWSVDGAWGTVTVEDESVTLAVLDGALTLRAFGCPPGFTARRVTADGKAVAFVQEGGKIRFDAPVTAGTALVFS